MISYIVITYNRCDIARDCLQALLKVLGDEDELIVVDNGSSDGTREMLATFSDRANIILSEENLGVSGGRNLGIRAARGEILAFLDDDARFLSSGVSDKIRAHLKNHPELAGLAFTILDEETRLEQYHSIPGTKFTKWKKPAPCTYFCGAGFAVRKDTFQKVGLFWEQLFYAGEELEFGYRVMAIHQHFLFVDDIQVLHAATEVARPSGQFFYYHTRNRQLIALRHLPLRYCLTHILIWWPFHAAKAICAGRFLSFCKGARDFFRLAPQAWRLRQRMKPGVVRSLWEGRGRLVY